MEELKPIDKLTIHFYERIKPLMDYEHCMAALQYSLYSKRINNALLYSEFGDEKVTKLIDLLKVSIKLSQIPTSLTVYHGTSNALIHNEDIESYVEKSDEIDVKTFFSTSTEQYTANSFMDDDTPVLLSIYIPENSKALWMQPLSTHRTEHELLLYRPKLKILSYEHIGNNYKYTYIKTKIGCDYSE